MFSPSENQYTCIRIKQEYFGGKNGKGKPLPSVTLMRQRCYRSSKRERSLKHEAEIDIFDVDNVNGWASKSTIHHATG